MSQTTNEPGFDTGTPTPPRKAWHARTWVRVTGAIAALIVACSFGAAAASGSHVTAKQLVPASSAPATTPAAPPPPADTAPAEPAPAESTPPADAPTGAIGDTMTITDSDGNAYDVTLTKVIDPAAPASEYDTPANGHHFVGAVFHVKVTSGKIDDAADNCAQLLGSDEQSYDTTVSSIVGYDNTSTLLKLNAGESQNVTVVFEVPNGVKASSVKWTPDSGMSDSTATWAV
jgi:hypothetical protein